MGLKERFYDELRTEFENGQRTSFLYRYLERERKDSPREDDYARLECCYARLEAGDVSQKDYLMLALQVLLKNGKLRAGRTRELLLEYGRRLYGEEFFRGKRRDSEKYRAMLNALEEEEPVRGMEPQAVRDLHRELLGAILCRDAQTYLYDAGRKKSRDMAVLEAYCEDKELDLVHHRDWGTSSGRLTQRELEQWESLFQSLRRDGSRRKVLIPIRIDPRTGAGLYIVGSDYYPKDLYVEKDRQGACYYAYFYLDEMAEEEDITLIFRSFQEELEQMCQVTCLDEAQRWYFNMLREDAGRLFHDNGPPPGDCPEELRQYFEPDEELPQDRKALEREGREAYQSENIQARTRKGVWKK